MKTIKLSEASRSLAEYATELDDDIVLVTSRNRPIAAVVSLKNADREVLALSRSPQFLKIIERSRRDLAAGRSRSLAEVRELFGLGRGANKRMQPPRKKRAHPLRTR
jgi:PHD/YefM family antitoxin component YafN of YafNO toxin-antitoxin module